MPGAVQMTAPGEIETSEVAAQRIDGLRRHYEMQAAESAARQAPESVEVLIAHGRVLLDTHRADAALAKFGRAAKLAPQDDRPVAWQIAARCGQYDFAGAITTGTRALESLRESVLIRISVGRAFLDSSRPRDAERYLAEAAGISPGDVTAVSWHAASLAALCQWDRAETIARKAIEEDEHAAELHYRLGQILLDHHQYAEALKSFAAALAEDPGHTNALEWQITALRGLHRYDEAGRHSEEAIGRFPGSALFRVECAWAFSDAGQHDKALARVGEALDIDARDPWALRSKIDFLRKAYRFSDAENAAAQALTIHGHDPRIHTAEAWVFSDQRRYGDALDRVEQALRIDPLNSWALRSKIDFLRLAYRFEKAEQAAQHAMQVRGEDPRVLTAAAWVLSDQGRYGDALDRIEQALRIDKQNFLAMCSRVDCLREAHRFAEAERACKQAGQAHPDNPEVYIAAAWVMSDQDRESEAAVYAAKALTIDCRHPAALAARIYFLRWARRFKEAGQAVATALKVRGNDPDVLVAAGWFYSDLDHHKTALEKAEQARRINGCSSWVLSCQINFLRAAGKYVKVDRVADQACLDWPDDPDMWVAAGWLHGDRDRYDEAQACFERALRANPRHIEALEWLVVTQRSLLRFTKAGRAAAAATELRPHDPVLRVERGRTYDARLAFDHALAHFAEVLDRDPHNVEALVARSATLRSLRRYDLAEHEITQARLLKPANRDLLTELGWIRYDQQRAEEAREVFTDLLHGECEAGCTCEGEVRHAVNDRERAAACYGLGWAEFLAEKFPAATEQFRKARGYWPGDDNYRLGLVWSLARQDDRKWTEAEQTARQVADQRPDPFAQACLGVIAFQRGHLASAERHLCEALKLDEYHGSHIDLGALYLHTARYDEAEKELREAVKRDWYDSAAHAELGCLFLQRDDKSLQEAEHEFRQALAIAPGAVRPALGLALALGKHGNDQEAESVLRTALRRQEESGRWRTHLQLAQLLVRQGDDQQQPDLQHEAYKQARKAIALAPAEPEPHFVAGVAQFRWACLASDPWERRPHQVLAWRHLHRCHKLGPDHVEAERYLRALHRELRFAVSASWGGLILAAISFILLTALWVAFFLTKKVSVTLVSVNTPVLAGLLAISSLLPTLARLKMPGFEADLQPQPRHESDGPTGADTFGPGRFTVSAGPTGQIPRRGESRLRAAKSTKHNH